MLSIRGDDRANVLLFCRSNTTLGILGSILGKAGCTALTAQRSADAWECLRNGSIDCVVLDLTNATHDAFAFFRACRSSRNTFNVPFLFLTPQDFTVPKFEGVWPETARDGWLALPCPAQQFLGGVRSAISANDTNTSGTYAVPAMRSEPSDVFPHPGSVRVQTVNGSASSASGFHPALMPTTSGMYRMTAQASEAATPELSAQSLFAGRLGTLQFSQILGLIEPLRLTGVLKINDGVRAGSVFFVDGKVHHAELNEIVGSEALFLLFHLSKGTFNFEIAPATPQRTVEGNTMSLLLEGMRKMDEAKAMVSALKERQATGSFGAIGSRTMERVG
jgi:hypothetical protein